jgi:hypothetical protein
MRKKAVSRPNPYLPEREYQQRAKTALDRLYDKSKFNGARSVELVRDNMRHALTWP